MRNGTTSVIIMWTTTKPVKSYFEFGLKDKKSKLEPSNVKITEFSTHNNTTLNNLAINTNYFFQITTIDENGNKVNSEIKSFDTNVIRPYKYSFVDLGFGQAYSINNYRHVVGQSGWYSSIWLNGTSTLLFPFVLQNRIESSSVATDINDNDEIVGYGSYRSGSFGWSAFYINNDQKILLDSQDTNIKISNNGHVISFGGPVRGWGVYWLNATSSPSIFGVGFTYADISDDGLVAGSDNYIPGGLGIFVGRPDNSSLIHYLTNSLYNVTAVNNSGDILTTQGLYHYNGSKIDFVANVSGKELGNDGTILGNLNNSPVLRYSPFNSTDFIELQDFVPAGYVFTQAMDINNNGDIVGYGFGPDSELHAFMLKRL